MNHISTWVTHDANPTDRAYLREPLKDVNTRLFFSNPEYKRLVIECCKHIAHVALTKFDGYKKPHGCSAANCGIPWNIIAIVTERGTDREDALVMINPRITERSPNMVESMSNCGSLRLADTIKIKRHEWVDVCWINPDGSGSHKIFTRFSNAFTVQHEIDHNLGIMIDDRAVK